MLDACSIGPSQWGKCIRERLRKGQLMSRCAGKHGKRKPGKVLLMFDVKEGDLNL